MAAIKHRKTGDVLVAAACELLRQHPGFTRSLTDGAIERTPACPPEGTPGQVWRTVQGDALSLSKGTLLPYGHDVAMTDVAE
jgi:hypothetical protein